MCKVEVVRFYEDEVLLVVREKEPFVPLKTIVENLGLRWQPQHRKLFENPNRWQVQVIKVKAQDGKLREMTCIPLYKLPAWLATISPRKVKPELREKLLRYQEECDKVLWDYWMRGCAVNPRKQEELPVMQYECAGYVYLYYIPADLLARILGVETGDLLSLLAPGDYIENPAVARAFRERHPELAHHIKSDVVILHSGMRKLFIKNLIHATPRASLKKLYALARRLVRYGIDPEVAYRIKKAREAGFTYEEISRMVGLSRDKVRHLMDLMREVMEEDILLPAPV